MTFKLPHDRAKKLATLIKRGIGISTKEMRKIYPEFYSGDMDDQEAKKLIKPKSAKS